MFDAFLSDHDYQREVRRAHAGLDRLAIDGDRTPAVRDVVLRSWIRSVRHLESPEGVLVQTVHERAGLEEARRAHPFHDVLGLLHTRLVEPATRAGLLVALSDAHGTLLWVEGGGDTRRRAEGMGFAPGVDWSEAAMGTSAPGLAIASRTGVQVSQAEHFAAPAQQWSCSAVPVLHPVTGEVIGVIDVTGGEDAVSSLVLPLLECTSQAVTRELGSLLDPRAAGRGWAGRVREDLGRTVASRATAVNAGLPRTEAPTVRLRVTGAPPATIGWGGQSRDLSTRHAELLTLLHWHAGGLSAAELAEALCPGGGQEVTVRAEIARLRKGILLHGDGLIGVASRPYRLTGSLVSDVALCHRALGLGDLAAAMHHYRGQLLPGSEAPGIREIRDEVSALLRETVLQAGSWSQLWHYSTLPEAHADSEVLMTVLARAPRAAPERCAAIVRLESLER